MHTILAVDDEPHVLKILRSHLEGANYSVLTATNGKEALDALRKQPDVDLILLDSMMPEMDGLDTLRELKRNGSHYLHIPVIMQTAKVQDYDAYEGIDAGAINYMTKPYTRELLLAAVENVLRDVDAIKKRAVGGLH